MSSEAQSRELEEKVSLVGEIARLKSLIAASIHLLPDAPYSFQHEKEVITLLVVAHELAQELYEIVSGHESVGTPS